MTQALAVTDLPNLSEVINEANEAAADANKIGSDILVGEHYRYVSLLGVSGGIVGLALIAVLLLFCKARPIITM